EYTKGLEFDAVLILNPTREEYPVDDGHARLLYVAATRALHELCVMHTGNLTGLIADPVPEATDDTELLPNTSQGNASRKKEPGTASHDEKSREGNSHKDCFSEKEASNKAATGTPITSGKPSGMKKPRPVAASPANTLRIRTTSTEDTAPAAAILQTYRNDSNMKTNKKISIVIQSSQDDCISQTPSGAPGNSGDLIGQENPKAAKISHNAAQQSSGTETIKRSGYPDFADFPPTGKLRPVGHNRIDLAVRWITKQPDGLYLQSRYGILRLSPIGSGIIRVTFAKGG
ncbi:MAG: ATP-binding domain-containing protein, partial [Acetatifactor sp.]|nr:ATP-binding domain-containing protein [Acetatifactor sp.]